MNSRKSAGTPEREGYRDEKATEQRSARGSEIQTRTRTIHVFSHDSIFVIADADVESIENCWEIYKHYKINRKLEFESAVERERRNVAAPVTGDCEFGFLLIIKRRAPRRRKYEGDLVGGITII